MSYNIKITPNYYQGTINAPQEGLLTENDINPDARVYDNTILDFETEAEAQKIIDDLTSDETYYLSHGEAARPTYQIIADNDPDPDCLPATGGFFLGWEEIDESDIPENIKKELEGLSVEYKKSGDNYDIYTANVKTKSKKYKIVFCPRTVALQKNADDLSGLDWGQKTYFIADND